MSKCEIQSTCPYCGVGCSVSVAEGQIKGDEKHPANKGALCVKGAALKESLNMPSRLLYPRIKGETVTWQRAIDTISDNLKDTIEKYGPNSVAMYVSGQILTEDYYVANKLMKGYVGSANIDTNSRLCMSSAVAAHIRAFGEDVVPVNYDDLLKTDLIVITGANTAWTHPVIFRQIQQAREQNPHLRLVVLDPRKTVTAEQADLHLALENDGDIVLYNGLIRFCIENGHMDERFIEHHTSGFESLSQLVTTPEYELRNVAQTLGLDVGPLRTFYQWFALSPTAITVFCQGINQSSEGVDKANSIINAHLLTGKIGKAGSGPFSITGQPNAMGGREVGGLANMLAVHRGFDDDSIEKVAQFWGAPNIATKPGLKAVDLFDAVEKGEVKVIWVMATNPVVSMPNADKVRRALAQCDMVIVSDITPDSDTAQYADVLLPAAGWGEKQGMVTNSERCMSRQRRFMAPPGEAKADWETISAVGRALCEKMGIESGFDFESEADVFREYARMTSINHESPLLLDISELADISDDEYQHWTPARWPLNEDSAPYRNGRFSTASGRANFLVTKPNESDKTDPTWWLNTGRHRDQWHTMTRTGHIEHLSELDPEPTLYLNSLSGEMLGVSEGELVKIQHPTLAEGSIVYAKAKWDKGLNAKQVFMSMHWAGCYSGHDESASQINRVLESVVDPLSGQPAFKSQPVSLMPAKVGSYITHVQRHGDHNKPNAIVQNHPIYSSMQTLDTGVVWRYCTSTSYSKPSLMQALSGCLILDIPQGWCVIAGRFDPLEKCFVTDAITVISHKPMPVNANEIAEMLGKPLDIRNLSQGLSGRERGTLVCSCFRVSDIQIQQAIEQHNIQSLHQLQAVLKCGTNCGSCIPELNNALEQNVIFMK
ncbi:molybdopterin-dependent oxidoreductase [Vibrio penaeicida]|uniref:nitrate reductase n=1 Tax=Vibrio penaeicida TaxID=104609 RepID=UPI002736D9CC|nr:molybdopterin-dependent oxidoreductase [Vibrio penaeicida]MDP2572461.1 molybdopterin-dependent oxidoreductase [Vibrio penaeicida]